jgi:hypothetical protein
MRSYAAMATPSSHARWVQPTLAEGEELQYAHSAVCVARPRATRRADPGERGGLAARFAYISDRLARRGGVDGDPGSVARSIAFRHGALVLGVTDRRVGLWQGQSQQRSGVVWAVERERVAGVQRLRRRRLLPRFRVHFDDGSWAAFDTFRARNVRELAGLLGAWMAPDGDR